VIVFVSEGLGNRSFDVPAEPVEVDQKGCMYLPHVIGLQAQQKIRIVNSDSTTHNIHAVPINNREWNKAQPAGTTLEETFAREEIAIPVKCNVHPWMRSYIAVFKHPFFSVTGADGHFDLHNLPPGEYTVEAWHEKLGTMKQTITVAAGEAKTVDFVFKARAIEKPFPDVICCTEIVSGLASVVRDSASYLGRNSAGTRLNAAKHPQ